MALRLAMEVNSSLSVRQNVQGRGFFCYTCHFGCLFLSNWEFQTSTAAAQSRDGDRKEAYMKNWQRKMKQERLRKVKMTIYFYCFSWLKNNPETQFSVVILLCMLLNWPQSSRWWCGWSSLMYWSSNLAGWGIPWRIITGFLVFKDSDAEDLRETLRSCTSPGGPWTTFWRISI